MSRKVRKYIDGSVFTIHLPGSQCSLNINRLDECTLAIGIIDRLGNGTTCILKGDELKALLEHVDRSHFVLGES